MANVYYDGNDVDDSNRVVDRLTPDPLPPSLYDNNNNNNNDNNSNTQQRLILLHSIIQRSLDRAEIPNRSSERLQRSPSAFTSFDSTPLTLGENTYLNCMQQLMLAQFESLDRKDILLLHLESFMIQQEEFHMGIQHLLRLSRLEENCSFVPPHCDDCTSPAVSENKEIDEGIPITSTVTVTATTNDSNHVFTCLKNASALVDVIWEESNERQVLVMDQINDIGAILQNEEMFRNALMMSKESKNLLNALEDTSTLLYQTSEVVQQFLQWEMEENKKVSSNEISEIDKIQPNNSTGDCFNIMPTNSLLTSENDNEKFSVSQEETPSCGSTIYSLKDIVLLDESPIKTENNVDDHHELYNSVVSSCNKSFHIDPSSEKYPTIAGNVYRSCAPHIIWQLRFYKFEAGILRFSKTAPDGKHLRWWTVFNASDILYVELDDSESCIGEAKPPLCQNECCCFSVYFKKYSDDVIRRVRFCCTKRSETLAWFFALRRSSQMARSRS